MKLTELDCALSKVSDLSPLRGMPLKQLYLFETPVTNLQPLEGMELETVRFTPGKITQGLNFLRNMKSLKIIGIDYNQHLAASEFWDRYDKGEFK
jgi:hypothetical protein